jgi:hypothetical protein
VSYRRASALQTAYCVALDQTSYSKTFAGGWFPTPIKHQILDENIITIWKKEREGGCMLRLGEAHD